MDGSRPCSDPWRSDRILRFYDDLLEIRQLFECRKGVIFAMYLRLGRLDGEKYQGEIVSALGMYSLLLQRPLPCWVRSHGRSPIFNKIIIFACFLWEGDRMGNLFWTPGSPPYWCLASLVCFCPFSLASKLVTDLAYS